MGTAAVIYARISKDTAGEHLGVDRQEKACRALATKAGLDIVEVLVDNDISAFKTRRRPAFEILVEMLKAGEAAAVISYHADRLYRRTTDLERLVDVVEATGAQVHTVAAGSVDLSTASGRMVARMLGAAAQHESERTGERMKMKHDELAAAGKHPGGRPPYGYAKGYTINAAEAEALRYMARRALEGCSMLALARELDAMGVTTREGKAWHSSSVRASLVNPAVAGLRVHRREVAGPGNWEPILDEATWSEVRAVIADPARKRARPAWSYVLAGLVESIEGDQMNGGPRKGAGGATSRAYMTRVPAKRPTQIGADDLEELVVEAVLQRLDDAVIPSPTNDVDSPGVEVAAMEQELRELAELRGAGTISLQEWMAARKPLQGRLEAAQKAAQTVRRPDATARLLDRKGAARKAWPTLGINERRAVIAAVVDRIVIAPATRGRWSTVDERVDVVWKV